MNIILLTGMESILPMNSGAEAVETVIKAVRKWGYKIKGIPQDQAEVIVCENNFHGRTIIIVGFSTDEGSRSGFGPYTPGFKIIPFGDAVALENPFYQEFQEDGLIKAVLDSNADGTPDVWNWYDGSDAETRVLLRKAVDLNKDGRVDVTTDYQEDQVVKEYIDADFDGRVDWVDSYEDGDQFSVEFSEFVPPEERGDYREFAEAQP